MDEKGPMAGGVNQRALVAMTPEEVDAFLAERHNMTMCTLNHDQTIHAVAMWYGFLEGRLAFETKEKSQKAQNLRRDPRMTVLIEAGERYEELRGVEVVGHAEVETDPERMWAVAVSVYERYYRTYDESAREFVQAMLKKRLVATLRVERVVSWHHRKLP